VEESGERTGRAIYQQINDKPDFILYPAPMHSASQFSSLQTIAVMALPLVAAIVLHEIAHGYVAYLKGDSTARDMGRLTLNPLAHIDPFGTVIMPFLFFISTGMLFAFAKPVPVNFLNLRRPKEDMVWVAAAGPATNFLLAVVSAGMIHLLAFVYPEVDSYIEYIYRQLKPPEFSIILFPLVGMLFYSVILNVVLGVINLIPIPPADGGRIVVGLLPARQAVIYSGIEKYGLLILIVIIMFNPFGLTNRLIWPMIIKIVDLLI